MVRQSEALTGCAAACRAPVCQGRWPENGLLVYRSNEPQLLVLRQEMRSMNMTFWESGLPALMSSCWF